MNQSIYWYQDRLFFLMLYYLEENSCGKIIHERFQWCRKSCYEFYFCFRKLNNSATCVVSDCGLSITLSYRYCDVFLSMALKREIGKRKTFSRNGSIGCKASSRTTAIGNEKKYPQLKKVFSAIDLLSLENAQIIKYDYVLEWGAALTFFIA